jgi:hypothetical protein
MEPEGSLPYSQEPVTWSLSSARSIQSIPHSTSLRSSHLRLGLPASIFWLSHQNLLSHACYMPCPCHSPWLDHLSYIWGRIQIMKLPHYAVFYSVALFHPSGVQISPSAPCSRTSWALLEKPPVVQLLKDFPTFYGTWRFITVFTRALHWSLSWTISIQSIPSHPI